MNGDRRDQQCRSIQTQTQTQTVNVESGPPLLQLRASHEQQQRVQRGSETSRGNSSRPSVRWESDVIDNENMNKKKTKICCIFHPQEEPDEECECPSDHEEPSQPSSSSSSSSESDEDSGLNFEERRARRVARRHRKLNQKRSESPNAYEVQPDYTKHQAHNH
ncbi:hypothetical protein ZYGR_0S00910 [Zygosaccharomyces rouxii]|uniref:Type 1 phosphatases regulator n=1 Tax=Zygosaccharomyces rouxii TaxID=4956 RepID=A0A1Q3A2P6_ZYGRO|nr:hypothetical protein ZYGR_0S00910 [Zygosaccharomyces rouxii]